MRVWTWNSCEYTHSLWSLHELEYFKRVCMHTYALFRAFEPSEWACNIMHICVCIYLCMYTRPLSLRFDMHVLQELVYVCKPPSPSSIQSAHVCVCVCVCVCVYSAFINLHWLKQRYVPTRISVFACTLCVYQQACIESCCVLCSTAP
jgi:hypothetical protein